MGRYKIALNCANGGIYITPGRRVINAHICQCLDINMHNNSNGVTTRTKNQYVELPLINSLFKAWWQLVARYAPRKYRYTIDVRSATYISNNENKSENESGCQFGADMHVRLLQNRIVNKQWRLWFLQLAGKCYTALVYRVRKLKCRLTKTKISHGNI